MQQYPLLVRSTIRLAFLFLLVAALILTRTLLVPLFLSVMLAYLLLPYASWLEKKNVNRILTNFIVILGFMAFVGCIVYALIALSAAFTENLSEINKFAINKVLIEVLKDDEMEELNYYGIESIGQTGEYVAQAFTATTNTVLSIGLLPVYTFLLLFYRDKFRDFISMLIPSEQEKVAQDIIDQASEVVPKYLKGLVIVCFILFGLNSLGFYLIGVKYALLFGLIAALFNLIPYLGTILGYGVVMIIVLGTQSPTLAFAVEINPLVIIFSLIASSMIWGLPGMLIIIPYLGLFKIICENVESLKPVGFLLGTRGTERHSITIKSLQRRFGWLEDED